MLFKLYLSCFLCLSITLFSSVCAQSTLVNLEPSYLNYSTDDGLPSSECHHTIQDQRGYIWIATDNGVSRFDGYQFRNFSAADGLKNNVIFYLQEDQNGWIWMLTMSGNLYHYDYKTDKIHAFKYNNKIQKYQGKYTWISPFYVDSLNTIYLGMDNLGILRIKEDGSTFFYKTNELSAMIALEVEDFLVYANISCPKQEKTKCLEIYNNQNRAAPLEYYKDTVLIETLFPYWDGISAYDAIDVKLRGSSHFAKKVKEGKFFWQNYHFDYVIDENFSYKEKDYFSKISNEKTILELENGKLLMGDINFGGIDEFDNFDKYLTNESTSSFLKGKQVSSMYKDTQGGFWVTTTKNGLYYLPNYEDRIINKKIGIDSDNISSFSIEEKNKLLFGNGKKGVYSLDLVNNKLKKLPAYRAGAPIRKIYRDESSDKLWIGSGNLSWLDNGQWNYELSNKNGKPFNSIGVAKSFNLSRDKKHIWSWRQISFFKINLAERKVVFDANDINIREAFLCVYEDFSGRVWLGNIRGLFEFKDKQMLPQTAHPAFQNRVEDITQLKDSTFVIATKGAGVIFWKGAEKIQLTNEEGLTSNMIENVYVDEFQRIWVGTSEGLNLIRLDENRQPIVKQFSKKNGLPSNEINQVEVLGDDVWVATKNGLVKLPELTIDSFSTKPIIEKILINGKPLKGFKNKCVSLNPNQNSLQIEFLTIDFKQHGEISYRYKLAPSQKEWNYSQNRRLDFSALNDGHYRLEIQSQNRDGFWSDATVFEFVISPFIWETWWFVLAAISAGTTILYFWIKRIKREANLVRKMAEAEQFALRSQMNPHFIFNCLASIQGFILTGDKDKAIRYLARFSKLIRTALKFMDKEKITLEEEIIMLTNYLELEKMRHGDKFNYEITIGKTLDEEATKIPPLMVQPVVENSILHAFVDQREGGFLKIQYVVEDGHFLAIVEDNGIGLEESQRRKKELSKHHDSVGTKIIARRLKLGRNPRESGLTMMDIKNEEGAVLGTRVVIDFGKIILS